MHPPTPAAASPLTLDLVAGPAGQAVVLAAFPTALYLGLPEHSSVLPVVTADALILPTAVRLAEPGPHDWGVEPGDVVTLGGNVISLPARGIRIVRTWRPRRVVTGPVNPATLDWTSLLADIGRGEGLTPRADDVLCGALLAARALGMSLPATLPVERTTSLSASLLETAHAGYAVPAVIDHLAAVVAGSTDIASTRERVLAIGHTSGAGLLEGIDLVRTTSHCPLPEGIPS